MSHSPEGMCWAQEGPSPDPGVWEPDSCLAACVEPDLVMSGLATPRAHLPIHWTLLPSPQFTRSKSPPRAPRKFLVPCIQG